jgi:hypothetical protein
MKSRLQSDDRMSNTGYHQNGEPNWWAMVEGKGSPPQWIDIPKTRGDKRLNCVVDLPPGTKVYCGAGKGDHKTVRCHVITTVLEEENNA